MQGVLSLPVAVDREKALLLAQKYVDRKRYDRALQEYQQVVAADPSDTHTLLKLGDLQIKMQAFADALATYDRVGQLYESQGFSVKAVAVYKQIRDHIQKRAPELADRFAHITPRLAHIYTQLQLTSDAIQAYDEAATRLLRLGKREEAVAAFREMVRLDPGNPLTHVRLAEALCYAEHIGEGLEQFTSAVQLLIQLSRPDDALRVVERALHFRANGRLARLAAEIYLQRGTRNDGLQALTKLQICFQEDPKDLTVLGMLAQAFVLLEQREKSVEVYKQMAFLARERGEQQFFVQLVQHLVQVAPDDDQVKALQRMGSIAPTSVRAASAEPDAEIESVDDDLEFVDEDDFEPDPQSRRAENQQPKAKAEFDPAEHARKAIADADSFRRLRLFSKAADTLRMALEVDPASLEIRYKLREVLHEAGDHAAMIAESLNIAILLTDYGYAQDAAPFLDEVLAEEPDNPDAIQLHQQIYGQPPQPRAPVPNVPAAPLSAQANALPSYDIESVDATSAMVNLDDEVVEDIDNPFAEEVDLADPGQLPSFAIDESESVNPGRGSSAESALDELVGSRRSASESLQGLEEALDEADFFAARGLFDDARAILQEQLRRSPHHPLVLEKLHELAQASAGVSGTGEPGDRSHVGRSLHPNEDGGELDESFRALDDLEMQASASKAPSSSTVDVDQMFAQFKEGVRSQIDESDSATHYDLGVAYKEMGLLSDAIKEFDLATRDPQRECMCHAMIGMIHLEQDDLEAAIQAYLKGLQAGVKTTEQELSLYYDLGIVYEMKNALNDALYYFQKIARKDPGYRDVADRITALEAPSPQASNVEDDFDRAFDDLFGN